MIASCCYKINKILRTGDPWVAPTEVLFIGYNKLHNIATVSSMLLGLRIILNALPSIVSPIFSPHQSTSETASPLPLWGLRRFAS